MRDARSWATELRLARSLGSTERRVDAVGEQCNVADRLSNGWAHAPG
ncbi:hypothetical protein PXO_05785 [Xanthomonas oryzae pv. oryzae PXO99A]|uniref:Uncharacterized protein n=1 Tax=Xanthomonas oryzae pv. oryzae (strain PXO99A) TaxID=360094 RepID=A0A0K0GQV4_XANOP|nr:hypothetical protein PXO_05785 [Xanthomonas oryzae pv. oryzae PXO99A]